MATGSDMIDLDMSANRWKYFRWTPRTAWITFVYVVAVPSIIGYAGYVTDVRPSLLRLVRPVRGRANGDIKNEMLYWVSLCLYIVSYRANTSLGARGEAIPSLSGRLDGGVNHVKGVGR